MKNSKDHLLKTILEHQIHLHKNVINKKDLLLLFFFSKINRNENSIKGYGIGRIK